MSLTKTDRNPVYATENRAIEVLNVAHFEESAHCPLQIYDVFLAPLLQFMQAEVSKMNPEKTSMWLLTGAFLLQSMNAYALPDPRKADKIPKDVRDKVASDPSLYGVTLLPDHEDSVKAIYVSPASRKVQQGGFSHTGYADCGTLKNIYSIVYAVPPEKDRLAVAQSGSAYSPFFASHYGNSVFNADLLRKLMQKQAEADAIEKAHPAEFSAYQEAKIRYEENDKAITAAEGSLKTLDKAVLEASRMLSLAKTQEEKDGAREELELAKKQREEGAPVFAEQLREGMKQRPALADAHAKAYGAVAPYLIDRDRLAKDRDELAKSYKELDQITHDAFLRGKKLLVHQENLPVGAVSLGYNIWSDEVNRVGTMLPKEFGAAPLPIFDVTADAGALHFITKMGDGSGLGVAEGTTETVVAAQPTPLGTETAVNPQTPFRDKDGNRLESTMRTISNQGAGVINASVSLGAYCRGTSEPTPEKFRAVNLLGGEVVFEGHRYAAYADPLIQQQVSLNYRYFVKAEPIDIRCSLKVTDTAAFSRKIEEGGFLFWRHSSDETTRSKLADLGVRCDVGLAPSILPPDEQEKWKQQMVQTYSQEVLADFATQYGTYTKEMTSDPRLPGKSGLVDLGPTMSAICGPNFYCQLTGIVLKSLDDIFGSRTGTSSTTSTVDLDVYRDYHEDSYRLAPGNSIITVEVRR